jgi:biotin transport system substrate-specific component
MSSAFPIPASSPRIVLADLVPGQRVRDALLVLGAAGLTGAAAQVSIPVPHSPVPVTGQTFAVLLTGAALGWRRGMLSMVLYLVAGGLGVPWYAHHSSGWGGPTYGYVLGFVLASTVVGWLAKHGGDRTPARTVATMTFGTLLIYAVGMPYLAHSLGVGAAQAFDLGVRPFLLGDALKVLLAAGLLPGAWWGVRRARTAR